MVQEGVVAVVRRGGRYLVIQRAPGLIAAGAWCFVGGAIEPGESQAAALEREFAEEVGATIRPVRKVWEYLRPDGALRLHWWSARLVDATIRPNEAEVSAVRWLTAEELARLPDLLRSNGAFLSAVARGEVELADADESRAEDGVPDS